MIHSIWQSRPMLSQFEEDWLNKNTVAFGEWNNLLGGLRRVIEYVKNIESDVTFENCEEYVQNAKSMFQTETNFTLNVSKGHDFFSPESHQQTLLETRTTGYNFVDACLKGGWANKTLNVLMGSPKVGKSMWLCNLCASSVLAGHNSIYITLEMSYQLVAQRIGSNLFNIPIEQYDEISKDTNYMSQKMKDLYTEYFGNIGTFYIEEFPTSSATAKDIETFILKKEEELSTPGKPFKFKNIFIDYINIMKDMKNPFSDNSYQKIKNICEDVRAMAQRNLWCVISLTQTNRSAYDATDITMSNVSESGGLIATVDSLFGIIQSPVMRAENIYYLKAVAIRNSKHMGDRKRFTFNPSYLRITEDATEGILSENDAINTNSFKKNNFNQNQNSNTPAYQSQPNINDIDLGVTEIEIKGNDLFSL